MNDTKTRGVAWATPLLALALGCGPAAAETIDSAWATDSVWDDGLAEVASYRAVRPIYGAPRSYSAVMITVKEEFDRERLIKSDRPDSRPTVTVLKQNVVREIPTPNYPYRMMTSSFVRRTDPATLVKATSGSHEWCGNSWKSLRVRDGVATFRWDSYFDGEDEGQVDLVWDPIVLLEDQLPMTLRGLRFEAGGTLAARIVPTLATTHVRGFEPLDATIEVEGRETISLPAGRRDAWKVVVRFGGRVLRYWLDTAGTHPVLKLETSAGDRFELESLERRAYWR